MHDLILGRLGKCQPGPDELEGAVVIAKLFIVYQHIFWKFPCRVQLTKQRVLVEQRVGETSHEASGHQKG